MAAVRSVVVAAIGVAAAGAGWNRADRDSLIVMPAGTGQGGAWPCVPAAGRNAGHDFYDDHLMMMAGAEHWNRLEGAAVGRGS